MDGFYEHRFLNLVVGDERDYSLKPTTQHIEQWLDYIYNVYSQQNEETMLIEKIFGQRTFSESSYFWVKTIADDLNYQIPSLEQIGRDINIEPNWDCKTAREWQEENNDIKVIIPCGFPKNSWDTERIPWGEYCHRRKESECDSTGFIKHLKNKDKLSYTIACEAKCGQKLRSCLVLVMGKLPLYLIFVLLT